MIDMPFEKLLVWQKGIELVDFVYDVTEKFPKKELFCLCRQAREAAVSIPANIAEGSQRSTVVDFARFITIAKGSLAELRTEMYIARRREYLSAEEWNVFTAKATELDKMLWSFHAAVLKRQKS